MLRKRFADGGISGSVLAGIFAARFVGRMEPIASPAAA